MPRMRVARTTLRPWTARARSSRRKPCDARPQADEGRARELGLQAGQALHRVRDRRLLARQQHLPGEGRAVQGLPGQDVAHGGQCIARPSPDGCSGWRTRIASAHHEDEAHDGDPVRLRRARDRHSGDRRDGAADWTTPAEAAGYRTTPRYDETMAYLRRLAAAAPGQVRIERFGRSGQGRDLVGGRGVAGRRLRSRRPAARRSGAGGAGRSSSSRTRSTPARWTARTPRSPCCATS